MKMAGSTKQIEFLHDLNNDVEQLELKYGQALNALYATRQELLVVLSLIRSSNFDTIKQEYSLNNEEKWIDFVARIKDPYSVFDELKYYNGHYEDSLH